jgi:hypothetical protein
MTMARSPFGSVWAVHEPVSKVSRASAEELIAYGQLT